MEGLWNYINYDSSGILAGGVLGVGLLVCGVVSAVSMGGGCTGLPGRPCGHHKMADYLLSAADVKWLGMEVSQCPNENYVALGCDLSRKKSGMKFPVSVSCHRWLVRLYLSFV